jgi:hypothetical protein
MKTDDTKILRDELLAFLSGGNAHMGLEDAIGDFPLKHINTKPPKIPYSFWHLLEHMRIVQWDILEFIRNSRHVSPEYPSGYWPSPYKKADGRTWTATLEGFRSDLAALVSIVEDKKTKFFAPVPHAPDYTIFREILLAGDHNAYHTSELLTLRQIVGISPEERW